MTKVSIPLEEAKGLALSEQIGWLWSRFPIAQPITIVTTISKEDEPNAAPKSWVTPICSNPWLFAFSSWVKSKTTSNILETKEFVVNIPSEEDIKKVLVTSQPYSAGINKIKQAGFTTAPSEKVKPPRIRECKAHIECVLEWYKQAARTYTQAENIFLVFVGRVVAASANKEILETDFKKRLILLKQMLCFGTNKYGVIGKVKAYP